MAVSPHAPSPRPAGVSARDVDDAFWALWEGIRAEEDDASPPGGTTEPGDGEGGGARTSSQASEICGAPAPPVPLGSASEAEDVVQDAWLRARQDQHADVRSPRAYLTTIE